MAFALTLSVVKKTAPLKNLLRDEAIPALTAMRPYFSLGAVRKEVAARKLTMTDSTLLNYLQELVRLGLIYDAGRGWYSTLAKPLVLDREEVSPVVTLISKAFPLLGFSVWSTQQINPWMHHLLGKFVTLVHVEAEGVASVWELLRDEGYNAYLKPGRREAKTFAVRNKTVIVRVGNPAQAPVDGHYALPEKVLVDLADEITALPLMDPAEFTGLFLSVSQEGRLDMAAMVRYAKRKRLAGRFLKVIDSIVSQKRVS